MPLFEYSGLNAAGKKVSGAVEAPGRRAVLQKLRSQGIFPTAVNEEKAASTTGGGLFQRLRQGRKIPVTELAASTRQLATLIGAGLPLDEALGTIARQLEHPRLGRTLNAVREDVIQGEALHAAMAKHPGVFPVLFVNMVQVGESSGTLDQALQRLADFLEEQARMKGRIRSAMAYPLLMAFVGVGVLFFLFAFVVPKVTRMLVDMDRALPLPTLLLIRASNFFAQYWWVILVFLALAALAIRSYGRTETGRMKLHRLALNVPLFGRMNLLVATARFTRTLGTLLRSGIPLLSALDITKNLMENQVLRQTLENTADAVREGEGLSAPLRRSGVFPPMVAQMSEVGERSGEIEDMLFRVADTYEHQVELTMGSLLSLLEPLMILFMGTVVGFIVIAILLPIFEASQGMG